MFTRLLHIGIAVKDLDEAVRKFSVLLDSQRSHTETLEDQKVKLAFFHVGDVHIELTEATSSDSPIAKFIKNRGEGIHHLSFEVDDIHAELARLKSEGFQLIDETPRLGADGYWIAFIHPRTTNGVLVEISQKAER